MNKVKVKFVNMWEGFDTATDPLMKIFGKYNELVIDENNPDYIICSCFRNSKDKIFEYCNYDAVRILVSFEPYEPDYNVFDYTVGSSYASNLDRYCRFPNYFIDIFRDDYTGITHQNIDQEILKTKDRFCNLIFSHERDDDLRKRVAEELSKYKRVDSAGSYLNNMKNKEVISRDQKFIFQSRYKFSIVLESTDLPGFTTEKIYDAYKACTIPIYCGDRFVGNELNKKAFIDLRDYKDLNELREKIEEIDNNDLMFLEMISQPLFDDLNYPAMMVEQCENFFDHIFKQNKMDAFRRPLGPKGGAVKQRENILKLCNRLDHIKLWRILEHFFREK
jgi:hypothetical protein